MSVEGRCSVAKKVSSLYEIVQGLFCLVGEMERGDVDLKQATKKLNRIVGLLGDVLGVV